MAEESNRLQQILNDRQYLQSFRATVKEMHASELLNFYIEVQIFKNIDDMDLVIRKAKRIFEKYLEDQSECEVNVDATIKQQLKDAFEYGIWDKTLFDEALREVLYLLQRNCLPVFMKISRPLAQRSYVPQLLTMKRRRPKQPPVIRSHSHLSMEQYLQIMSSQKKQQHQRPTSPPLEQQQRSPPSPPSSPRSRESQPLLRQPQGLLQQQSQPIPLLTC